MESLVWTATVKKLFSPSGEPIGVSTAPLLSHGHFVSAWEFPSRGTADEHPPPSHTEQAARGNQPRRESCRGSMAHHRGRDARDLYGNTRRHRRQRLLDAHCREPFGDTQRSYLGTHFVSGG